MAKGFAPWSTESRRVVVLGGVLAAYLLFGASVFVSLEERNESEMKHELHLLIKQFIRDTGVSPNRLRNFTSRYSELSAKGATLTVSNWEFGPSVFFALTVVTTIGYGTVAPVTSSGQAFCVVYALFGIPLVGILLSQLASLLSAIFTARLEQLQTLHSDRRNFFNLLSVTVFMAVLGTVVFLVVPAAVFCLIEGWSFGEGFYCAFITLTTIGFGDYVPGQQSSKVRSLYKLMTLLWLIIGLAYLTVIIEALSSRLKLSLNKVYKHMNNFIIDL